MDIQTLRHLMQTVRSTQHPQRFAARWLVIQRHRRTGRQKVVDETDDFDACRACTVKLAGDGLALLVRADNQRSGAHLAAPPQPVDVATKQEAKHAYKGQGEEKSQHQPAAAQGCDAHPVTEHDDRDDRKEIGLGNLDVLVDAAQHPAQVVKMIEGKNDQPQRDDKQPDLQVDCELLEGALRQQTAGNAQPVRQHQRQRDTQRVQKHQRRDHSTAGGLVHEAASLANVGAWSPRPTPRNGAERAGALADRRFSAPFQPLDGRSIAGWIDRPAFISTRAPVLSNL